MFAVYVECPNFSEPLTALIVGERPEPAADAGSLRVKVAAASLNWHDLWTLQGLGGMNGRPETYPMILGCDGAGTLDDGTAVAIYPVIGDADWKDDETLDPARSVLTEQLQGTFADYVVLPRRNVVPLPSGLDVLDAAVLGASWLTAYRMLFTRSGLQPGQTMLVQGASGGVATALIQLGRAAGIEVWVTGRSREKLRLAGQLGAQRCFASGEKLPRPVDVVLDLVGSATFEHSMASVRTGGCIVVAGAASGIEAKIDLARVFIEQIEIKGVFAGTLDEFRRLLAFVAGARLSPHIGETLPMSEAAEGFRRMQSGALAGKILLKR